MADLVNSLVTAAETTAFALHGPGGVLTSAGVGLIWTLIRPGGPSKYQQDFSAMMKKILDDSFKEETFSSARSTLDTFNKDLNSAAPNIIPQNADDVTVTRTRVHDMIGHVKTGGSLAMAFTKVKEHLPWFDASAHRLLVACLEAILQAYFISLCSWEAIAKFGRNQGNISLYNEAKREVSNILDSVNGLFEQYRSDVKEKIEGLKRDRLERCVVKMDKTGRWELADDRYHASSEFSYQGYVLDDVTGQKSFFVTVKNRDTLGQALENLAKPFLHIGSPTGGKEDGSFDDTYLEELMVDALAEYKRRLPAEMDKTFQGLIQGLDDIVTLASRTIDKQGGRYPFKPEYGPALVYQKMLKVPQQSWPADLKPGDQVQYRYKLYVKKVETLGELQQIYVGDGHATMPTIRALYLRTSDSDPQGKYIATIEGVGILTWPSDAQAIKV
ncbi:hypothetical protein H1R20_g3589, partial [Candolleomyces eurysporus]